MSFILDIVYLENSWEIIDAIALYKITAKKPYLVIGTSWIAPSIVSWHIAITAAVTYKIMLKRLKKDDMKITRWLLPLYFFDLLKAFSSFLILIWSKVNPVFSSTLISEYVIFFMLLIYLNNVIYGNQKAKNSFLENLAVITLLSNIPIEDNTTLKVWDLL